MNDLTTYVLDWKAITDQLDVDAVGVIARHTELDTRLQAIADAWNELEVAPFYYGVIRNQAPELCALLDALEGTD